MNSIKIGVDRAYLGIVLLAVFFSVYQDSSLVLKFGEIARCPVVFMLPFFGFYFLLKQKVYITYYDKVFSLYILYLTVISLIYTLVIYFRLGTIIYLEENILVKNIKMILYPISGFSFSLFIYNYLCSNDRNIFRLAKCIYIVQLILIVVIFIELTEIGDTEGRILDFFHSIPKRYWRIRLLTYEASWSGSVVIIFTFLPIYFAQKKILKNRKLVYLTSIFFFGVYSYFNIFNNGSKGFVVLLFVAVLPKLISFNTIKKYAVLLLPLGLAVFLLIFPLLYAKLFSQLYESVTFGTRFTGPLATLITFFTNPFGVGMGPYVYYYPEKIKVILDSGLMDNFNLAEITGYLDNTKNLSAKSYFWNQLMYGGVGFLLFFYAYFIKKYKKMNGKESNVLVSIVLLYVIMGCLVHMDLLVKYEIWLLLGIVHYLEKVDL